MGDGAWRVALDEGFDPAAVLDALRALEGVTDVVVADAHALVCFDPAAPPSGIDAALAGATGRARASKEHHIAVAYDGEDLAAVASRLGCSVEAVVARHAGRVYEVLRVGFMPGFAYVGPLDAGLVLPRRERPRARVAAGSVAIAGARTGVYPFASPGGWHLIGRALEFEPFDRERGAVWSVGDRVRFEAR